MATIKLKLKQKLHIKRCLPLRHTSHTYLLLYKPEGYLGALASFFMKPSCGIFVGSATVGRLKPGKLKHISPP